MGLIRCFPPWLAEIITKDIGGVRRPLVRRDQLRLSWAWRACIVWEAGRNGWLQALLLPGAQTISRLCFAWFWVIFRHAPLRENQQQLQAHVPLRQQSQEKANFSFPIVLATVHSDEPTLDPTPIPELTPDSDWPDLAGTASSGTWGLGQRGFPKGKLGFCHQKRLNRQKQ